jgi:autotransporter-associated beta strand protein
VGVHFQLPSLAQGRLRRRVAGRSFGAVVAVAILISVTAAQAQSFTWGGAGSTTATTGYNLGTNWANPAAGAPPVAAGQSAVFDATGSTSIVVSAGPVAPDSWAFNPNSQSYLISGAAVNFSLAGATGGIINNANSGQTISISNNIAESVAGVQVQQLGNSILTLTGTNTYTGGTIINAGTLQLGMLATKASIVGAVTNASVFSVVNANTAGITSITNNGGLTAFLNAASASTAIIDNNGGGETTFGVPSGTDTATAGNATITNRAGGFTGFAAMTTAGSATIVNQSGGGAVFIDNSSAGSANITNSSGVTFFGFPGGTDAITAGNATIDNNNGGTIFSALANAGSAHITNHNGGGTEFGDQASAGSATIINNRNGFTVFGQPGGTDTATAGNATITNNYHGETDFNAFATAGSATIITNNGGATFFYDNSTGGNAQFITNGTGYVDFSSSSGRGGGGRITAGSIAGSGFYYIGVGNTLVVGGDNLSTEVSGVIADLPCGCRLPGFGSLEKVGTGTMILSGTNTYTGTTAVNGGVLDVAGSIVSSGLTTVNANAALTGAGTVGNTTIAGGGIFLPGNGTPGSSMTVAGNLAFQSGALYFAQLNSVTSTFANVTGAATLAGTVGASFAPGSTVLKQYTILTDAGGHSGGFDGAAVIGASGGLVASLSYDPTHVFLNFALHYGATPGLNVNQQNVGNGLNNFFNANGGIPAAFATLAPAGLTRVSGELATGSQQATFDAMNLFMGLLSDPFITGRGDGVTGGAGATAFAEGSDSASAYAARQPNAARDAFAKFPTKAEVARNNLFDPRWSVWGAAYGGSSTTDGNAALGSNSTTARAFGFVAGADYRISPATLAGFALAGGGTNFSVNGSGSGRSDLFQAGAFVRHDVGAAYVSGALAYGWQDVTTDRTVTVAGVDRLHAEFNANAYSGRVEGGYRFLTPWMGVTPYAAGQFTTFSLPAYAEQVLSGAGAFALNYVAKDVTASRSELGLRSDRSFAMQNAILTLRGRLAWAHDFNTDRNIQAVFQTLPGASFVVNGAAQAHDSALTTASAEVKWLNGFSLAATFEGEFSSVTTSYAGKGVARYTW